MDDLPMYGEFLQAGGCLALWIIGSLLVLLAIGYLGAPLIVWTLVGAAIIYGFGLPLGVLAAFIVVMALFLIVPIRRAIFSNIVMKILGPIMPVI